ncbi:ADP-ribosylation factor [Theileria orientalis]|uniref:ADP-ribosylation factor n=1 Tax=Theileria orientalis TaxID=68886 RepID=A0A976MC66_THEOR|nr:ADP-ribosylation factor [Theileria orientalis]
MEFKVLIKTFPFNAIRFTGKLCQLTLRSLYLFIKFLFKSTTNLYVDVFDSINKPSECILIVGSRNSGKSSLLYRIKLSEFISTTPTGSSVEEQFYLCRFCLVPPSNCIHSDLKDYDKIKVRIYELGFNDSIHTYQHQIQICNKVIYVIDSFGNYKLSEINKDIITLISEHNYHHRMPKYVFFITKNDMFGGIDYTALQRSIEIPQELKDKHMFVLGSSVTGQGIFDSIAFLLLDRRPSQSENSDLIVL